MVRRNEFCNQQYGSYLDDENDGDALRAFNEIDPIQYVWTGLNINQNGFWEFVDGTGCGYEGNKSCDNINFPYWLDGEPNNISGTIVCDDKARDTGDIYQSFDDWHCNSSLAFLCEDVGYHYVGYYLFDDMTNIVRINANILIYHNAKIHVKDIRILSQMMMIIIVDVH